MCSYLTGRGSTGRAVTPPAAPHFAVWKRWARSRKSGRFAGEHDAGVDAPPGNRGGCRRLVEVTLERRLHQDATGVTDFAPQQVPAIQLADFEPRRSFSPGLATDSASTRGSAYGRAAFSPAAVRPRTGAGVAVVATSTATAAQPCRRPYARLLTVTRVPRRSNQAAYWRRRRCPGLRRAGGRRRRGRRACRDLGGAHSSAATRRAGARSARAKRGQRRAPRLRRRRPAACAGRCTSGS